MSGLSKRDRMIPWYFVLFFMVIAAVNAVMVTLALRTHTGLVTDHPYEKGLAYNRVIEQAGQQDALGWRGTLDYQKGRIRFSLSDINHQTILPERATVSFMRPTQDGMDFSFSLEQGEAAVRFPVEGLWEVRVDAYYQGHHYQTSKRIVVP